MASGNITTLGTCPKVMTNQVKKATSKRKPAGSTIKTSPAYFLSLDVENVLCFKGKERLDLSDGKGKPAQWTVILGNNGVGKTTLLRCLALIEKSDNPPIPALVSRGDLIWEELQIIYASFSKVKAKIFIGELSNGTNEPLGLEVQIHFENKGLSLKICLENENEILGKILSPEVYKAWLESQSTEQKYEINKQIYAKLLDDLHCYGYGATRKNGKEMLSETALSNDSASLFSDDAKLINAEEWLLQTDYAVKSSSGKTRTRLKKEFNHIIEILKQILPDIEDIRITPADEERPRPRAEFFTPYGWVRLASLGLGYRATISWMVDLAVRLFQRYPDSADPLAEPAIVLVDEIDLHMHPTWQRTIMKVLTERFPNTQFIVTAHSPLVVQASQGANIVLLRREGDRVVIDNDPEIIANWRVDQILTSVFDLTSARPANLDHLLARRQKILSKSKLSKADQVELKQLEEQIGSLPTAETSEDIKAMDIIRRAAKLLEKSGSEAVE